MAATTDSFLKFPWPLHIPADEEATGGTLGQGAALSSIGLLLSAVSVTISVSPPVSTALEEPPLEASPVSVDGGVSGILPMCAT